VKNAGILFYPKKSEKMDKIYLAALLIQKIKLKLKLKLFT